MKKSKFFENEKKVKIVVLILCLLRVLFQMGIPVVMRAGANHDDKLFVNYANDLLLGNWLGEYTSLTLNKVPGFALYLATMKVLNIPYMMGVGIFYTLASYIFYMGIKYFVKSEKLRLLLFVYVLFSPVMYGSNMVMHVYRLTLMPIVVLMLISSYLLIYGKRQEGWKKILPWSIVAGICFMFFHILREDATWISCFVYGATLVIVVLLFIDKLDTIKTKIKKALILALPFIICFAGVTALKIVNYKVYGIYETNDFKDTHFAEMGKKILKVQSDYEVDYVWITRGTIEKVYELR